MTGGCKNRRTMRKLLAIEPMTGHPLTSGSAFALLSAHCPMLFSTAGTMGLWEDPRVRAGR